jgi:cytochrome bd ubiquinol oxidase subunit I
MTKAPVRCGTGLSYLACSRSSPTTNPTPRYRVSPRCRPTFQAMVGIGVFLALLGAVHLYRMARRRGLPSTPWFFRAVILAGPLAVVALIAGWVTTEVGRQPWVVYGVMRTEEAVTAADGIPVGYATLAIVYTGLIGATAWVLRRLARAPLEQELGDGPR